MYQCSLFSASSPKLVTSSVDTFYFFFCLIALARTSKIILNKTGTSGHSCLVPDLGGDNFSFSVFIMMLTVGLYVVCSTFRYVPSTPTLLSFFIYHKWMLTFVKCFLCLLSSSYDFYPSSLFIKDIGLYFSFCVMSLYGLDMSKAGLIKWSKFV